MSLSGFPDFNTLAVGLLVGLLGMALGSWWGRRKGRQEAERDAEQERQRALRATSLWHQQPVQIKPVSPGTKGKPHGVHSAPSPELGSAEGDGG